MKDLEIGFDPLPPDSLRNFIVDHLAMLDVARTGADDWHPIGFFLKNRQGEWLGGLLGDTWGGWMNVRFLWLAEVARGPRHGTELMDAAEAYAASGGCLAAALDTHSYEALGFFRSVTTRCSASLRTVRPVTRNISCANGLLNPDLRNPVPRYIVWASATN